MADADVQQIQEILDNDPAFQAALQQIEQMRQSGHSYVAKTEGRPSIFAWANENLDPIAQRALAEHGITKMPHDWSINLGQHDGRVGEMHRKGYWDRNSDWIMPLIVGGAGVVGGAGAAGAFGGGGAGAPAGGVLPSTAQSFQGVGFAPTVSPGLGTTAQSLTGIVPSTAPSPSGGGDSILGKLDKFATSPTGKIVGVGLSQLGRLGEGQAGERGAENDAAASADRLRGSIFGTEQGASTHATDAEEDAKRYRAQLGITAPTARTKQALLGSLIQNMQPVSFGDTGRVKVPTMTGGLTPAAISEATRGAGGELERQAIDALLSGSDMPSDTDFQAARLPAPQVTPYQGPGTGESILSGLGVAGNTLQGILASLQKKSTTNQLGETEG